jgi:hypothetical protein
LNQPLDTPKWTAFSPLFESGAFLWVVTRVQFHQPDVRARHGPFW